jgi:broad specificity phosphatase PhoE|tara:strand:- start:2192 stop:2791 length:600 start_codon:yes stop_codon:yes gene_type:complete
MKLILVRHGETRENIKGISQGQKFGTLTKEGLKQAKLVAKRLKDVNIDVIYSSDLSRAFRTAKEIAKNHKNIKIKKDKRLRETDHGEFSGKKVTEGDWDKLSGKFGEKIPPGGESLLMVEKRISEFYKNILKKYEDETILIVSHGGPLYILKSIILKISFLDMMKKIKKLHNTAISEFEIDNKGSAKIICLACNKHLLK